MRASMATWRTSSFESGTGFSLGSGRLLTRPGSDQHDRAKARAGEAGGDRAPADHDQGGTHPIDRRWFLEKAQHEPSPPDKAGRARDHYQRHPTSHLGNRALNWSSSRTLSFSFCAFANFEPAPGPATTESVLPLTLPAAFPPNLRTIASASGRLIVSNVPVNTKVLPVNGPSLRSSASEGSTPAARSFLTSVAPGPWKYMWTSRAMLGPTPSTLRRSSSVALCSCWMVPKSAANIVAVASPTWGMPSAYRKCPSSGRLLAAILSSRFWADLSANPSSSTS